MSDEQTPETTAPSDLELLRAEVRAGFAEMRAGFAGVDGRLAGVDGRLAAVALATDVAAEFKAVRAEIAAQGKALRSEIAAEGKKSRRHMDVIAERRVSREAGR